VWGDDLLGLSEIEVCYEPVHYRAVVVLTVGTPVPPSAQLAPILIEAKNQKGTHSEISCLKIGTLSCLRSVKNQQESHQEIGSLLSSLIFTCTATLSSSTLVFTQ
jgi:hypothetical protein